MFKVTNSYQSEDSLVQYGDGLFETMLVENNHILNWTFHCQRLVRGCKRLGINQPNKNQLIKEINGLLEQTTNENNDRHLYKYKVVKMLVSRGKGLRGFATLDNQLPYVSFLISDYEFKKSDYLGVSAKFCKIKLPNQPFLAGLKHCSSLIYLLAKREITCDEGYQEGLLFNEEDFVIEAVTSNLFLLKNNQWQTPILNKSGVEGTFKSYLIENLSKQNIEVIEKNITKKDIELADSIFLTNAVKGIVPIKNIKGISKLFKTSLPSYINQTINHPCLKSLFVGS